MSIKKVLIAEDELLVARVLQMALEKKQFEARLVIDDVNVIKMANEFNPDLIIMDIFLKNKSSGINAAKIIRKNGIKSPIVFTTGNSYEQTKIDTKGIENSYIFIKPVDVEELIKYIEVKLN